VSAFSAIEYSFRFRHRENDFQQMNPAKSVADASGRMDDAAA
jgi:hypothetical protein